MSIITAHRSHHVVSYNWLNQISEMPDDLQFDHEKRRAERGGSTAIGWIDPDLNVSLL